MDTARRGQIAARSEAMLVDLERAVRESWTDLMPASSTWPPASQQRARAATKAALEGLLATFEQGDLDDRTWTELRDVVFAHGHATPEEAADLLRAVRIVAVDLLAQRLAADIGLTHEERWQLQRETSAFCADLLGVREEIDSSAVDQMLAELERTGQDLRAQGRAPARPAGGDPEGESRAPARPAGGDPD
ncbi:MAG: hypothetical protein ACRDU8_06375 [Egibacteraceae bacterium]